MQGKCRASPWQLLCAILPDRSTHASIGRRRARHKLLETEIAFTLLWARPFWLQRNRSSRRTTWTALLRWLSRPDAQKKPPNQLNLGKAAFGAQANDLLLNLHKIKPHMEPHLLWKNSRLHSLWADYAQRRCRQKLVGAAFWELFSTGECQERKHSRSVFSSGVALFMLQLPATTSGVYAVVTWYAACSTLLSAVAEAMAPSAEADLRYRRGLNISVRMQGSCDCEASAAIKRRKSEARRHPSLFTSSVSNLVVMAHTLRPMRKVHRTTHMPENMRTSD